MTVTPSDTSTEALNQDATSAEAELDFHHLTAQHGIRLPAAPPLLHFARRLDIVAWTIEPVTSDE